MLEAQMPHLLGLIMREAGKSAANAVAEVREAVDFLRYYADEATARLTAAHRPLGPVACISPWTAKEHLAETYRGRTYHRP